MPISVGISTFIFVPLALTVDRLGQFLRSISSVRPVQPSIFKDYKDDMLEKFN
jgi:hypothetical protein